MRKRARREGTGQENGCPTANQADMSAHGSACAVLWHYTGLRVWTTAREGEGFDYWVTNGSQLRGMEVSGTLAPGAEEMQQRHQEKQAQLLSILPVGGYVVIVGFARREIIISYHAPQEAEE